MRYDPKTAKFPYPEITDRHYLVVKKDDGTVFDADYPYIDDSKGFKFKRFWLRIPLTWIVFPMCKIMYGLRIHGKENLKKHKEEISKGIISVSNHIHLWDYLFINKAIWPKKPNVLVWAPNIRGENGVAMRLLGGIPIPEGDYKATLAYMDAVRKRLDEGGWLHIYPEGSMWEYYALVRPFHRGSAYFAVTMHKPILPIGFSFRKPSWIRRKLFKQIGMIDLHIGEPLYPKEDLSPLDAEIDLATRAWQEVNHLCGIEEGENPYTPLFDKSKRVDYYTDEYGKK